MQTVHSTDLASFLADCESFVQSLADIITQDGTEVDEMAGMRQKLENYKSEQMGQHAKGSHALFEEAMYVREFQREKPLRPHEMVRLFEVSSVARLYQLNELETKPTLAHPSAIFNHAVCLIREDITKLEVDIIVNSTDSAFAGSGTLDRTVFKKGGPELRDQVERFAKSKEGDVHMTPGYQLPARNIIHVVPPNQFQRNTKAVLRKIYREVLHTAVLMKATSIAIPCIGTGMLNYPRRDCASLAMEEIKRFLESAEPTSLLEKIVLVTYSSNDEFIYKSLLPVYFPPVQPYPNADDSTQRPVTPSSPQSIESRGGSASSKPSLTPRRSLFGSIGEAFRSVRFGKQPETSRQITTFDEHALIGFEAHAHDCTTCKDINRLYQEGRDLCEVGYPHAQLILRFMDMAQDQTIYTKPDQSGQRTRLEVPADLFPLSVTLLSVVEQSFRDESRTRPFVSQNRPYEAMTQSQTQMEDLPGVQIHEAEVTVPIPMHVSGGREKPRAEVATYSSLAERWDPIFHGECSVHIYPRRIDIRDTDYPTAEQVPLLSLELTQSTKLVRHATDTEILLSGAPRLESVLTVHGDVLFRSRNRDGSEALLKMLLRAKNGDSENTEASAPTDSYPEWNRRLRGIRDDLRSKDEGGQPSNPPPKVTQSVDDTAAGLLPGSQEQDLRSQPSERDDAELLILPSVPSHDPSLPTSGVAGDQNRSPLATEIHAHLITDLKTRPGSYIGKHIDAISSALHRSVPEISAAIEELAVARVVHNTLDGNTWVVSNPPKTIPVLRQQPSQPRNSPAPGSSERETGYEYCSRPGSILYGFWQSDTQQATWSYRSRNCGRPPATDCRYLACSQRSGCSRGYQTRPKCRNLGPRNSAQRRFIRTTGIG